MLLFVLDEAISFINFLLFPFSYFCCLILIHLIMLNYQRHFIFVTELICLVFFRLSKSWTSIHLYEAMRMTLLPSRLSAKFRRNCHRLGKQTWAPTCWWTLSIRSPLPFLSTLPTLLWNVSSCLTNCILDS